MENEEAAFQSFTINKILTVQQRLYDEIGSEFHCYSLYDDDFHHMVDVVIKLLPKYVNREAVRMSLQPLAGVEIDDERLHELSWRLAGNLHRLKRGEAVHPWAQQRVNEWLPVQVMSVRKAVLTYTDKETKQESHRFGAHFEYLIQAGLPAGRLVYRTQSFEYCKRFKTEFGFSKYDHDKFSRTFSALANYQIGDITEFFRLRAYGLFSPKSCKYQLDFSDLMGHSSSIKFNRDLFKRRERDGFPCPMGYELHQVPCYKCEVGAENCKAACHMRTYRLRECPYCHTQGWFDPGLTDTICVDCASKAT